MGSAPAPCWQPLFVLLPWEVPFEDPLGLSLAARRGGQTLVGVPRVRSGAGDGAEEQALKTEDRLLPAGMRVLLAEDEPLIAIDGEAILLSMGVSEVVWVRTLPAGMNVLDTAQFHAALLDLRLGRDLSIPLARPALPPWTCRSALSRASMAAPFPWNSRTHLS